MTIFRLCRSRFSPKDSSGSRIAGGRWNSPGRDALYASSSLALACLEILVHLRNTKLIPTDYVFCEIAVEEDLIKPWTFQGEEALAKIESQILSREFGDSCLGAPVDRKWLEKVFAEAGLSPTDPAYTATIEDAANRKPVHAVPSVIIPREMNYLINPHHSSFDRLVWGRPEPFRFDPRLIGSAPV